MKILFYVLFCIPIWIYANVQDSTTTHTHELQYDLDSDQKPLGFNTDKIREFLDQSDFDYTEYEEPDNWWTQSKNWISQLWREIISWLFGTDQATGFWAVVLEALPYILVIGVLVLLGWLFMKVNPGDILLEKEIPPQIVLTDDEDIIQNQDIQQLIQQALQQKNYRLAIRYYYLFVLKKLSDVELIQWEAQKTNTDYIKELTDDTVKNQFKTITKLYDFIWYGSFDVNEKSYQKAEKEFIAITNTITD